MIKYNLTLLRCFLFPPLLCQSFVYSLFLFCFLFSVLLSFQTFLPQHFGLHPPRFQKSFPCCSKMKFTALASRGSGTPLSYTTVFNSIHWHQANQFPLSTLPFTISSGFIIWHRSVFADNHPTLIAVNLGRRCRSSCVCSR